MLWLYMKNEGAVVNWANNFLSEESIKLSQFLLGIVFE